MLLIFRYHCRIELVEGQYITNYGVLKSTPEVDYTVYSAASTKGWDAHDKHHTIDGRWSEGGTKFHINVLERTAIKFAIFSLLPLQVGKKRLRVMTDNITASSYINRQGGVLSMLCNNVTIEMWKFCIRRSVYISAAHITGKENIIADLASREFQDSREWILVIDMFALNLTNSFQIMHHGCQILNVTSLIA